MTTYPWRAGLAALVCLLVVACAPSAPSAAPAAKPTAAAPLAAPAAPSTPPAAAPTAAAPTPAPEPAAVRVGVLGILVEAGLYIALERGYFAEVGLTPELITFDTGARAIPALATRQVDAGGGAFSPGFVNATLRGVDVKLVASISTYEPSANSGFFMIRKELIDAGAVRDWPDLRGRTIAVPPGRPTVGDFVVARGLARGGLTFADVTMVELPFPDMVSAFGNGNIDAAHTSEPLSTLAADRGLAVKWRATADYMPGLSPALLTYGPSLLEGSPDVGTRLMVAYLRGAREFNRAFRGGAGRDEIVQILTKHTSVKDAALYDRMGMSAVDPNGTIDVANLNDQAAFYAEFGASPPIDVATLIDPRFREAALARLGPYQP